MIAIGVGDAASRLIGFFVTVYLARVLGVSSFGIISIGYSVLGYLGQLSGSGIQLVETRNAAAGSSVDRRRVGAVTLLRLAISLVVLGGTAVFSWGFVGSPDSQDAILLSALSMVPLALSLDWFFQGREHFVILSTSKIIHYAGYFALVLLFVSGPGEFRIAPLSFAAGLLMSSTFLLLAFLRRYGDIRFDSHPGLWKEFAGTSLPLGVAMVAGQSAVNLAPIVLGIVMTTTEVGMFSAAMKIIALILMLDRILNVALLPLLSRIRIRRPSEMGSIVTLVFKAVLLLVLPATALGILWARPAIDIVFGYGYDEAVPILRILSGYVAVTLPNSVLVCTLLAGGRERTYTRMLTLGSAILALFVVILTLVFGAKGAAAGVVTGELIMFCMFLYGAKGLTQIDASVVLLKPLAAWLGMSGVMVLMSALPSVFTAAAGIVSYVLILFALRATTLEEIRHLRQKVV
jgi:O-antigen/teichoic acid export membrane protein